MKENILKDRSFAFALRCVKLYKYLCSEKREYVLSKQLLRSGTAIGALIAEGEFAQSRADFVNKLSVALKEANETVYWIALLSESGYINQKMFESIKPDNEELIRLLVSSIKTVKSGMNSEK